MSSIFRNYEKCTNVPIYRLFMLEVMAPYSEQRQMLRVNEMFSGYQPRKFVNNDVTFN
jgi:hypothetical protein